MTKLTPLAALLLSIGLTACNGSNNDSSLVADAIETSPVDFSYDFTIEDYNAVAIFSDYPKDGEAFHELGSSYENLPATFSDMKGWKLSSSNHSDDVLMAIKIPVDGLRAATLYKATLTVDILTNVSKNCVGIGGAPGESVYVKLAASKEEPLSVLDNDMYRINIDIGNQSQSGIEGLSVGNIANSIECGAETVYEMKTLAMAESIDVMSDDTGKVWLTSGFDSGFEGYTEVFITKLTANIVE